MSEAKPASPGLRIVGLETENVKRVRAVSLNPDGSLIEITGENDNGKTSLLDSIFWALGGEKHIQSEPIRQGETKAHIKLNLGKLIVTRRFTAREGGGFNTTLTVENHEGAKYSSPQAMLNAMVGELTFDPLAFTDMKPDQQFAACRRFVPGVDFDAIAAAQKEDYATRTAFNRQAKETKAQADGVAIGETITAGLCDETALVAQLEQAGQHNAEIEARRGRREQAVRDIADLRRDAQACLDRDTELAAQIAALLKRREEENTNAAALAKEANELQTKLDAAGDLPAPIDTAALKAEIETARANNAVINAALANVKRKAELEAQAKKAEGRAEELTKAMEARDKQVRDAVAAAKMPVEGLSFGDNCVLLNGLPFDQASGAVQLAASVAIAAAMNPTLRVIRVADGSRLDTKAMKRLAEFAEAHDMQIWVETVESGRPGAIVIEDGRVKAPAPKSEAA